MHTLAPYTIRCFDGELDPKKYKNKYSVLDEIQGQHDLLKILEDFVASKKDQYTDFEDRKTVIRFRDTKFDHGRRIAYGWLDVGTYGVRTDIINFQTGAVDFKKTQDNAEIIPRYFCFFLPSGCDEGIALLASYQGQGVKTLFSDFFLEYFSKITDLRLQMNPLSYDKALAEWQEANAKEIRAIKYVGFKDKADALSGLGHEETDLVLRPKRNSFLGKLKDFKNQDSEQYQAIEALTPLCSQVKAVLELGGKHRVFRIGPAAMNSLCQIELDESVELVGGLPELDSIHSWSKELLSEFVKSVYPGKQVAL